MANQEQQERVMASKPGGKKGAGAKGGGGDADEAEGGKKKKTLPIIIGAVVLLVALGAGAFFMMSGGGEAEAKEEPPPVPGEVLVMEPITVNLEGGHYLQLGISLQLVEGAAKLDGSKALDHAIATFSMQKQEDLHDAAHREKLREELTTKVIEAYEKKVMAVYLTQFVTQ